MIEEGKSEAQDQIIFVNWVHRHYPAQWEWLHHSPNGQARSKPIAAKLKLMGVKAGFPDLLCLWPAGQYHGCVIEMKLGKGRASAAQKRWIEHFNKCGFAADVLTLADAKAFFSNYMKASL